MASSSRTSEAGASSPTALPMREMRAVELVSTKATRFSWFGVRRRAASRAAIAISRSQRSGSAT